jgi:hypothetical protein
MSDSDRSAVDTLKGYFYQFDQSILKLLSLESPEDSVPIECLEDIDVKTATEVSAIQCKYYAKTEYNHSVIKDAVKHMLNHYKKVTSGEKQKINYQINGHYKSGHEKLPSTLNIDFLKKHFLTYTIDKVKYEHHIVLGLSDAELKVFLTYLKININSPEYETQFNQLIELLSSHFNSSKFCAEMFYYNNALRVIKELSIIPHEEKRKITKRSFLEEINTSHILFNEWFIEKKGKNAHFRSIKKEYFTFLNISPFERFFLIEIDPSKYIRHEVKDLFFLISLKWTKISKYGKNSFCPYIFIHGIEDDELREIKNELFQERFKFIDGHDYHGAPFNPNSILQDANYQNQIKVKIINNIPNLETTVQTANKTRKIYQFYINTPFFECSDPSIGIHNIQIERITDIKEII